MFLTILHCKCLFKLVFFLTQESLFSKLLVKRNFILEQPRIQHIKWGLILLIDLFVFAKKVIIPLKILKIVRNSIWITDWLIDD